ncbi:MAG: GNAT family N-acetyltransferase [Polyangiaceae bacterium]
MTSPLASLPISRKYPARAITVRAPFGPGSPSLTLRPTVTTDAEAIADAINASLPELHRFMPWSHHPQTALTQLERLKGTEADFLNGRDIVMAFFEPATDLHPKDMLAMIGLHPRTPLNPAALEIGYWAATPHSRRGLTTLGVQLMTLYAFEKLGSDRVQVMCDELNVASRRVIEKCGFVFEGTLQNVTHAAPPELVEKGFLHSGRNPMFALVPESFAALEWPRELRARVSYTNFAGYLVA